MYHINCVCQQLDLTHCLSKIYLNCIIFMGFKPFILFCVHKKLMRLQLFHFTRLT